MSGATEEQDGTVLVYDSDLDTNERGSHIYTTTSACCDAASSPPPPHPPTTPRRDDRVAGAQRSTKLTRATRCAEALLSLQSDAAQPRRRRGAALLQLSRVGGPYHALCTGATFSLWVRYPGLDDAIIAQTERYFAEEPVSVVPCAGGTGGAGPACPLSGTRERRHATVGESRQVVSCVSGCRSPLPRPPRRSQARLVGDNTCHSPCVAGGAACMSAVCRRAASTEKEHSMTSTQAITESYATCVTDDGADDRSEVLHRCQREDDACAVSFTPSRAERMALQLLAASDGEDVCDACVCAGCGKEKDARSSSATPCTSAARRLPCRAVTVGPAPDMAFSGLAIYDSDEEGEARLLGGSKACAAVQPSVSLPTMPRPCKASRTWPQEGHGCAAQRRLETATASSAGPRPRCGAAVRFAPALAASVIGEQQWRAEQMWLREQQVQSDRHPTASAEYGRA